MDAQVAFDLSAQLHRDERVDPELMQRRFDVQLRRGQTEFAGRLFAQVGLELPSALVLVGAQERVEKIVAALGGVAGRRCAEQARNQRRVQPQDGDLGGR